MMVGLWNLTRRNCKLFFKDKGMFFSSLITPIIILVLYAVFLARVYKQNFVSQLPIGFAVSDEVINATVGGQLVSSLLAVSCVTVAFCSNLLMIQDRVSGAISDINVSPVKRSSVAIAYFLASAAATLIVTLAALGCCIAYLGIIGWYMTAADVALMVLDVVLLTLFGVALSSCVNFPLKTSGQASAVGTIVSSGYGFFCGAYMPLASFSKELRTVLSFLPGTYGTSLVRNHAMAGAFREMGRIGFPDEVIAAIKDSIDCNIYFFEGKVSIPAMYAVLCGATVLLVGLYVIINVISGKNSKNA